MYKTKDFAFYWLFDSPDLFDKKKGHPKVSFFLAEKERCDLRTPLSVMSNYITYRIKTNNL